MEKRTEGKMDRQQVKMKERGMENKVSKGGKERRDGSRKEGEEGRRMGGGEE